jgi:hypothetical protein
MAISVNSLVMASLRDFFYSLAIFKGKLANRVNGIDADSSLTLDRTLGLTNTTADA